MIATNHVTDLNKVQWASFFYKNQWGNYRLKKPKNLTVHNKEYDDKDFAVDGFTDEGEFILKPALEVAKKLNVVDRWIPHCKLQLSSNHTITYAGERAISIWKTWQAKTFKAKKK